VRVSVANLAALLALYDEAHPDLDAVLILWLIAGP
jgi:hypothetical protein